MAPLQVSKNAALITSRADEGHLKSFQNRVTHAIAALKVGGNISPTMRRISGIALISSVGEKPTL